jgi:chromate transporter
MTRRGTAGAVPTPGLETSSGFSGEPAGLEATRKTSFPSLLRLFRVFFGVGSTSFGLAILQSVRSVTVKQGWLSRAEIDEGLGLVQLYPGAMMVDLVTYIGYRTRRVRGALVAAAGFIAPSLVLTLGLSWLYTAYGATPGVASMVIGLDAIVVGVVASVAVDLAAQHVRGRVSALLALAAFALAAVGANPLWLVAIGLLVGVVALRTGAAPSVLGSPDETALSRSRLAIAFVPAALTLAGVAVAVLAGGMARDLVSSMATIGSVAFGNGNTILPVLQQDVVTTHHWLSPAEFGVGVAFGQVTPGPILITAAFVGFRVGGLLGGVLAALAIFAPSVAMTTVAAEIYPYLRRHSWVKGAIAGIMAAFVGLLAWVALSMGRQVLTVPAALVLAAGALVAIRAFKLSPPVVFGAGLALWASYLALGGPA